jgi:hypothetical protein
MKVAADPVVFSSSGDESQKGVMLALVIEPSVSQDVCLCRRIMKKTPRRAQIPRTASATPMPMPAIAPGGKLLRLGVLISDDPVALLAVAVRVGVGVGVAAASVAAAEILLAGVLLDVGAKT